MLRQQGKYLTRILRSGGGGGGPSCADVTKHFNEGRICFSL